MKNQIIFLCRNFEEIIAAVCLIAMTFITFINVILRYFFHSPLLWDEEVTIMLMGWAVFLGISAAFKRNMHLGIEFFVNKVPARIRIHIHGIIMIILLAMNIFLTLVSLTFILDTMKRTSILQIPYKFIYLAPFLGFLSMSFYSLKFTYQYLFQKDKFAKRYEHDIEGAG